LASTAEVDDGLVRYVAAPGETNAVVFTLEDPTHVRISDPGALISAGPGCVSAGADVVCDLSSAGHVAVLVKLGDGHDNADLSITTFNDVWGDEGDDVILGSRRFSNFLRGGPGNDHLTGGSSFDGLQGGYGDDVLLMQGDQDSGWGGPGNDTINAGQGPDVLRGGSGDDILTGNSGRDTLFADGMNLRLTPTALIGEGNDMLSGIDEAFLFGGNGRNVINARAWRGSTNVLARGGDDVIVGGFGRDLVAGGAGEDRIAGGAGLDLLAGERGDDLLLSRDRQPDQVGGGPGRDSARVDRFDTTRFVEVFLP
jgi:Ca2+-binding RTX toxin-like protein